jgi:hypothetical protein
MTPGVIFLILALCGVALSLWAGRKEAGDFGLRVVLYVIGRLATIGFGIISALFFLFGAFT